MTSSCKTADLGKSAYSLNDAGKEENVFADANNFKGSETISALLLLPSLFNELRVSYLYPLQSSNKAYMSMQRSNEVNYIDDVITAAI